MQIITIEGLNALSDIRWVDARSGPDARERFLAAHVKGAIYADLDNDLASIKPDAADGGRHPLPSPVQFSTWLGNMGMDVNSNVVVYDDKAGANAAARFWWMLKSLGHQQVYVLSGGMQALEKAGWQFTSDTFTPDALPPYPCSEWQWPLATMDEVENAAGSPLRRVIDVREGFRYRGEKEPIDKIAGHIPGAINLPYLENMDSEGHFLPKEQLREKYKVLIGTIPPSEIIVHCGSGVTACHTLLAMEEAGLSGAKLYVGSWSEWSRNNKPIATGTEP